MSEQVERLALQYEVHVYSNRVVDLDLNRIVWHRIPALPGPHLFAYCWWLIANRIARWWGQRFDGLEFGLIYSPGINCFDADIISVHVVFGEYYAQVRRGLKLAANPVKSWPRLLHRRIYCQLAIALERVVYGGKTPILTVVSARVGKALRRYGRFEADLPIIFHGVDTQRFSVEVRRRLRTPARVALDLQEGDVSLLLVGNDWKSKGLPCILEAIGKLEIDFVRLLVVGRDIVEPYRSTLVRLHLEGRVKFLPLRSDVEFYYAATDIYVGPSLEDAFGMPPAEAMACGVPSIVSSKAGVSEIITEGVDGFILEDPRDSDRLATLIGLLCRDYALREKIGGAAVKVARQLTWDNNAAQLDQLFQEVIGHKANEHLAVPKE